MSVGHCARWIRYAIDDPEAQIQQCNWQVASPSTPANYFHLLRRQVCNGRALSCNVCR
jgi:2-oxoglutarate dehydrogenase complex dehydrogenase (E1) component-like enzyme